MGFKTGKHGKVYNDSKSIKGSGSDSPDKFDGSENWIRSELDNQNGDGEGSIIYTNKHDKSLTVEMHPIEDDDPDADEDNENYYNAWYIFPAKNGKGIPNSPHVVSETGGYTRKDAEKELLKVLKEEDD